MIEDPTKKKLSEIDALSRTVRGALHVAEANGKAVELSNHGLRIILDALDFARKAAER